MVSVSPACVSAVISGVRDYLHAFSMNFHYHKQAAVLWETVAVKWILRGENTTPFAAALEGMQEAETRLLGSVATQTLQDKIQHKDFYLSAKFYLTASFKIAMQKAPENP